MDKLRITPIFAPAYSPDYNPIEYVFSKLKKDVKKRRIQNMIQNKMVDYNALIPKAVCEISKNDVNNCIDHVLKLFKIE